MLEESQEHFLNHFLAVLRGKAEAQQVSHQPAAQLIKKLNDFQLVVGGRGARIDLPAAASSHRATE